VPAVNFAAIAVVVVAAFVISSVYYMVLAKPRNAMLQAAGVTPEERPQPWKIALELVRSFALAYVIARLVVQTGVTTVGGGLQLGFWLWLAFPLVLLSGSIVWDSAPWKMAAIHAGDWLLKIMMMAIVLGVWR
jgi:hypothetical protein